ncbi:hypothetical protein HUN08_16055 [Gordonia sp. X0973]|uniref:DUF6779 domain-containing protein n=1 Tax=Gordonia sp. X0973 TaxID=2742602 RepID=UPI000F54A3BC|nr:DUF6779 domain-containing protein [Gordonia sp. X0973]QKT08544.1 hypothetical protein HUN08_16055 [Gordonia sp. X0973]
MTTSEGRSAGKRSAGSPRGAGQWFLGLLIVLALVASCLMIWSKELSVSASVAVVAALWAAVLGAIGITRYRRQAEVAEARGQDMRLVYELQLEREIAARRQYEMDIEAQIRAEVTAEANRDLHELQQQIAALRASLEAMMGQPLPEQRVALPNERLRELASSMSTYTPDDSVLAATDFATTAPPSADGRHAPPPQGGRNDLTEIIPVVEEEPAPEPFAPFGAPPQTFGAGQPTAAPTSESTHTPSWSGAQAYTAGAYVPPTTETAEPADVAEPVDVMGIPEPVSDAAEEAQREAPTESWVTPSSSAPSAGAGRRRRAEGQHESGRGISAAELFNQLRGENS